MISHDTSLLNASQTPVAPPSSHGRPENIPEKFWDANKQELRLDALLKSYAMLERKLSQSVLLDPQNPDQNKIKMLMGIPESADGYEVQLQNDLLERDPAIEKLLHENGFSSQQVQIVYDLAAQNLIPMIVDLASEFQADREIERLTDYFGGKEKFDEVSKQLLAFGQQTMPEDVLKGLASSYEGVLALYRMMESEEPLSFNSSEKIEPTMLNEKDLKSMMRDPKYWREQDPSFIAKITDGFKRLYKD